MSAAITRFFANRVIPVVVIDDAAIFGPGSTGFVSGAEQILDPFVAVLTADRSSLLVVEHHAATRGGRRIQQHWLHAELNKPLDPTDVARAASTPEMAAEMYIASVMLVDEESFMEKSYLDELARQLKLEPGLKVELEKQVRQTLA
mgnify:CR=1 FL=1